MKDSRTELLAVPLVRARDLMRVLSDRIRETTPASRRTIDAALKACENLLSRLPEVESSPGLRNFRRELYRTWAIVLEAREVLIDPAHVRVFDEVERSIEAVHVLVGQFEKRERDLAQG